MHITSSICVSLLTIPVHQFPCASRCAFLHTLLPCNCCNAFLCALSLCSFPQHVPAHFAAHFPVHSCYAIFTMQVSARFPRAICQCISLRISLRTFPVQFPCAFCRAVKPCRALPEEPFARLSGKNSATIFDMKNAAECGTSISECASCQVSRVFHQIGFRLRRSISMEACGTKMSN